VAASGADNTAFGETAVFGAPGFGVFVGGEAIMVRASRPQCMSRYRDLAVMWWRERTIPPPPPEGRARLPLWRRVSQHSSLSKLRVTKARRVARQQLT